MTFIPLKSVACVSRIAGKRFINVEARIAGLGLKMPDPVVPKGSFVNFAQVGNLVFLSGHLPQVCLCYLWPFLCCNLITLLVIACRGSDDHWQGW